MTNLCASNRALTFLIGALLWGGGAWAAPAATITHMSGTLAAMKPDGSTRVLALQSEVESGETISTQKDTFARLKFSDGGEVVLRPDSVFKIEGYNFNQEQPKQDSFFARMVKGGARFVTGLIGKRDDRNAYGVRAATATIGIRGTQYVVLVCPGASCSPGMKDGAYTLVFEGSINVHNEFGEITCGAGQICFTPLDGAPILLPEIPAGVDFTPPPSFLDRIGSDAVLDTEGNQECAIGAP